MSGLFLKLLNMSISASVLIVVVVLARCLLRRSPKWIHYLVGAGWNPAAVPVSIRDDI